MWGDYWSHWAYSEIIKFLGKTKITRYINEVRNTARKAGFGVREYFIE